MTNEYVRGTIQETEIVLRQLDGFRISSEAFLTTHHPSLSFANLSELITSRKYKKLINQDLLKQAIQILKTKLEKFEIGTILNPERVWIATHQDRNIYRSSFGGFHNPNQGYQYIQQISVFSMVGALANEKLDINLTTLELLRSYVHDTLHFNSYRVYRPLPLFLQQDQTIQGRFYRFQYGINFRKYPNISYSAKDPISRKTTRNLGILMDAVVDEFAQRFTKGLAEEHLDMTVMTPFEEFVLRDCIGEIDNDKIELLKEIESQEISSFSFPMHQYLRNLRIFGEYVTLRYRNFLNELDPQNKHEMSRLILDGTITGRFSKFSGVLNELTGGTGSFRKLFKCPTY